MKQMISVITPAHNEAQFIRGCLDSVQTAAQQAADTVEHIVVLNRCADNTGRIALESGARVVTDDSRNLSRIRNTGVNTARGEIVVTIDADSQMTPNMLVEVQKKLDSGKYIGGGVLMLLERVSLGIICSLMVAAPFILRHRVSSAGMFWCLKKDFDAIGGFDETLACIEDIDFAKRLKKHGQRSGKRYGTILKAHIVTSCRKFDQFGDWFAVRDPKMIRRLFKRDPKTADRFYYDVRSETAKRHHFSDPGSRDSDSISSA